MPNALKKLLLFLALLLCGLLAGGAGLCSAMVTPEVLRVLTGVFAPTATTPSLELLAWWLMGVGITALFGWLCVVLARALSSGR